jgi:hypothetical protein
MNGCEVDQGHAFVRRHNAICAARFGNSLVKRLCTSQAADVRKRTTEAWMPPLPTRRSDDWLLYSFC